MMTTEDYKQLVGQLRHYAAIHNKMRLGEGIYSEEDLDNQAADAIEELIEKAEKQASIIRVETPLGALIARPSYGAPDYPGIYVDIRRQDADQDLALALVEFTATEGDLPDTGHIITRVYGDALAEEYTERVVHEKIEDYFKVDDSAPAKYRVRISELRYGDVVVEANSEEEAKTIASGKEIEWFDSETTDMTAERID